MQFTHEHREIQKTQLAQALEHLVRRKDLGRLPFIDVRVDVLVDVARQRVADLLVVVGQLHVRSPSIPQNENRTQRTQRIRKGRKKIQKFFVPRP